MVSLGALAPGERVRMLHGEEPIELLRHPGATVTARSSWCPHMGCEVRWRRESSEYVCPCHDGRFDADDQPVAGPPTRSLRESAPLLDRQRVLIPDQAS